MTIRTFMPKEYEQIPKPKLEIFIGSENHTRDRICLKNSTDMKILQSWEQHSQERKRPYKIKQKGNLLFLLKERLI